MRLNSFWPCSLARNKHIGQRCCRAGKYQRIEQVGIGHSQQRRAGWVQRYKVGTLAGRQAARWLAGCSPATSQSSLKQRSGTTLAAQHAGGDVARSIRPHRNHESRRSLG